MVLAFLVVRWKVGAPRALLCPLRAYEIKAEMSGVIVDVVAANGSAVEYGQVLFKVRPD